MNKDHQKRRKFILTMQATDDYGTIQRGNSYFTSVTGHFTENDAELAKRKWRLQISKRTGVVIYPQKCVILNIFELDIEQE